MAFTMNVEPAAIKMVDRERGDLFAVCLPDRSLIVQLTESLHDSDKATTVAVPGQFAITEGKPNELWLRIVPGGTFARCMYLSPTASCPYCASTMDIAGEKFVCSLCYLAKAATT